MSLPSYFYDVNIFSVAFRLFLAVLYGGIIGLERGTTRRPAGFRTHILVCVGAALAMLTNQYICETGLYSPADPSRLGAQVITGVGFLGVGTILVTGGGQKIKGLTTAAGLWASACIGLALGIGFYSGAIASGLLVFIALRFLKNIESFFYELSRIMDIYVELNSLEQLKEYQKFVVEQGIEIYNSYLNRYGHVASGGIGYHMTIKIPKGMKHAEAIERLGHYEGIYLIEEV
ncbi:MAG: MgtC/SapB family protein [Anaerovoracaceae bacterium]|jgi:putative Mg2+ transporter-C (MgtC) family protein|nr:MgtC/SapB family protein [Clostridiales bacterium]